MTDTGGTVCCGFELQCTICENRVDVELGIAPPLPASKIYEEWMHADVVIGCRMRRGMGHGARFRVSAVARFLGDQCNPKNYINNVSSVDSARRRLAWFWSNGPLGAPTCPR